MSGLATAAAPSVGAGQQAGARPREDAEGRRWVVGRGPRGPAVSLCGTRLELWGGYGPLASSFVVLMISSSSRHNSETT